MTEQSKPKASSIRCNNCGHHNLATATVCLVCDSPLTFTSRFKRAQQIPTGLLPPTDDELDQAELEAEEPNDDARQAPPPVIDKTTADAPRKNGIKCPDCEYVNRVGDLFCVECGASILSVPKQELHADITQPMKTVMRSDAQTENIEALSSITIATKPPMPNSTKPELKSLKGDLIPDGCFQFTSEMRLRFTDIETGRYIDVSPTRDKPLLIGRSHASLPIQPEIDLTPFLMEQHGVSRRHALIRMRDLRLEIQDLNSTNGTGINGFRFQAKDTHQIRNSDIVTLGRVSIKVSFLRKDMPSGNNITDRLDV